MTELELLAALKLTRLPKDLLAAPPTWQLEGLTPRECKTIEAAIELGRRALTQARPNRKKLLRAQDAGRALLPRLSGLAHEEFWVLLLTSRLELVEAVRVASGGLTSCSVSAREVFAPALINRVPAIMTAHNHPSGDPLPSGEDQRLFLLLDEAANHLNIRIVDHLVIGDNGRIHSQVEGSTVIEPIAAEP